MTLVGRAEEREREREREREKEKERIFVIYINFIKLLSLHW